MHLRQHLIIPDFTVVFSCVTVLQICMLSLQLISLKPETVPIFTFYCCCNTLPQAWTLQTAETYSHSSIGQKSEVKALAVPRAHWQFQQRGAFLTPSSLSRLQAFFGLSRHPSSLCLCLHTGLHRSSPVPAGALLFCLLQECVLGLEPPWYPGGSHL